MANNNTYKRPVIVWGNSFYINISLEIFNNGTYEDLDLTKATDLKVYLICATHNTEIPLDYEILQGFNNVLRCFVDYRLLHTTSYGIAVEGYDEHDIHFRFSMLPKEGFLVVNNTSGMQVTDEVQVVDISGRCGWGIQAGGDLTNYYTKIEINNLLDEKADESELANKQDTLVSGTNIKTINNESLLGSGNIHIEGTEQLQPDWEQTDTSAKDYIKNKPTIPAAQVNSDWNASTGVAKILNKPDLNNYATKTDLNNYYDKGQTDGLLNNKVDVSTLNNDYYNKNTVDNLLDEKVDTSDLSSVATSGSYNDLTNKPDLSIYATVAGVQSSLATKQDELISGTNIKTINNESLLGTGNITIQDTREIPFNESTQNITARPNVDGNNGWRNFIAVGGGADYLGTINTSFLVADRNRFYDIVNCLMLGWNSTYYGLHDSIGATENSSIQFVNANVIGSIFAGANIRAYSTERNLYPVAAFGYHINVPEPTDIPLFILGTYNYIGSSNVPYNSAVLTIGAGDSNHHKNAVIVSKDGNLLIQPYDSTADTTAHYFEDIDGMVNVGKTLIALNNSYNALYSSKQDTLVSGTNIKTINNQSLLGSGNIDIEVENNDEVTANALYDLNSRLSETEFTVNIIPQETDTKIATVNERIDEVNNDLSDIVDEIDNTNFANSLILTELHNNTEPIIVEYGTTLTQETLDKIYANPNNTLLKRNDQYYTLDHFVRGAYLNFSSNGWSGGSSMLSQVYWYYRISDDDWFSHGYNLQERLWSGTNIKTINGNDILGSGDLTISGGVQSDWNETDTTSLAYIQNKPDLTTKQDTLVSGTNIKTINGNDILGSGDLTISGSSDPIYYVNLVWQNYPTDTTWQGSQAIEFKYLEVWDIASGTRVYISYFSIKTPSVVFNEIGNQFNIKTNIYINNTTTDISNLTFRSWNGYRWLDIPQGSGLTYIGNGSILQFKFYVWDSTTFTALNYCNDVIIPITPSKGRMITSSIDNLNVETASSAPSGTVPVTLAFDSTTNTLYLVQ